MSDTLDTLARQLEELETLVGREVDRTIFAQLEALATELAAQSPVDPLSADPGALARGYYTARTGPWRYELGNEEDYSLFVYGGAAEHVITPRNAPMLAWPEPGGDWLFAHGVVHPGQRPNEALNRSLDEAEARIAAACEATVTRLVERLSF